MQMFCVLFYIKLRPKHLQTCFRTVDFPALGKNVLIMCAAQTLSKASLTLPCWRACS